MPVAAPADKRFRRSHVQPGKKRRWMPSWRTIATVTVITIVAAYGLARVAGLALSASLARQQNGLGRRSLSKVRS